ncbi:unnamed protein product [Cylicocyclus nassatus]|uniref:Uncharacterized protein n=1 Tax=Cylicocyclus nassatus TaxID=53992 RepID=A0AA36M377_CYLNA|nr:unnamed protein product [Cylicocyclus nassatus]
MGELVEYYQDGRESVECRTRGLDKLVYLVGSAIAPIMNAPSLLHHQQLQQLLFHLTQAGWICIEKCPRSISPSELIEMITILVLLFQFSAYNLTWECIIESCGRRDPSIGAICDFYDLPSFYHLDNETAHERNEHLKKLSFDRNWRIGGMAVPSRNPQQICVVSFLATLLDTTPSNVAYQLKPKISEWKVDGEVLQIAVEINCNKERIGRLLIGKGDRRITEIGKRVNDHMHSLYARQLFVRIIVKHNGKVVKFLD